ncbi:MAG: hypothetical protein C0498_13875, partial [Anaerolinea sp.]|nr:hypothetical protein [Anaerolinea sp.]
MESQRPFQAGEPIGIRADLGDGRVDGIAVGRNGSRNGGLVPGGGGLLGIHQALLDLADPLQSPGVGTRGQRHGLQPDPGPVERAARRGRRGDGNRRHQRQRRREEERRHPPRTRPVAMRGAAERRLEGAHPRLLD